jgi:hypothetical protein
MTTNASTAEDRLARLDQTISCRRVFGVASLPLGSPVELEVIFEVSP